MCCGLPPDDRRGREAASCAAWPDCTAEPGGGRVTGGGCETLAPCGAVRGTIEGTTTVWRFVTRAEAPAPSTRTAIETGPMGLSYSNSCGPDSARMSTSAGITSPRIDMICSLVA